MKKLLSIFLLFCAATLYAQTPFDSFDTSMANIPIYKSKTPQKFRLEVVGEKSLAKYLQFDADSRTLDYYDKNDSLIAKAVIKNNEVKFLSVDPLTKKYPELTPYQFASNTPIWGVDWDGAEVRIYTEITGLTGHAFLTVGTGKDLVAYSYGRYAGVFPTSGVTSGKMSPTGPGVLARLTGMNANNFIKKELLDSKAEVFEVRDANDKKTITYMDAIFNSSGIVPEIGQYKNEADAHIIDKYNILSNSCVTKTINGAKAGGTKIDFIELLSDAENYPTTPVSPSGLQNYLMQEIREPNSTIQNVTFQVKSEFNVLKPLPSLDPGKINRTDHQEDNLIKRKTIIKP